MRKHLYLVTEHRNEEKVGAVAIRDSRMQTTATKNEEGTTRVMDMDTGETFRYKVVGMGYVDFDGEADCEENIDDAIERKLRELGPEYLEKADVADFLEARASG